MKLKDKTKTCIAAFLLVLFISMQIVGMMAGESDTVLTKAVNICLECIGIG